MTFTDRLLFIGIGIGVGLILTYITYLLRGVHKRQDTMIKELRKKKNDDGILERGWATAIALVFTLSLLFYSVYIGYANTQDIKEKAQEQFVNVCQAGETNRTVLREMVDAIYTLATVGIQEPKNDAQLARINAYIDRVNAFRDEMYNKIHPTKACEPYVSDDHVEPSTPDIQHVKRRP